MQEQGFYQAASAVVPLLLLVLATEQRLAFAKKEWAKTPRLHLVAVLLGSLVVAEVLALGALLRDDAPIGVTVFVVATIAAALALTAWGIGWSIWSADDDFDLPKDRTFEKKAFYGIGVLVLVALALSTVWALT